MDALDNMIAVLASVGGAATRRRWELREAPATEWRLRWVRAQRQPVSPSDILRAEHERGARLCTYQAIGVWIARAVRIGQLIRVSRGRYRAAPRGAK